MSKYGRWQDRLALRLYLKELRSQVIEVKIRFGTIRFLPHSEEAKQKFMKEFNIEEQS
jgi:hypothetical protein